LKSQSFQCFDDCFFFNAESSAQSDSRLDCSWWACSRVQLSNKDNGHVLQSNRRKEENSSWRPLNFRIRVVETPRNAVSANRLAANRRVGELSSSLAWHAHTHCKCKECWHQLDLLCALYVERLIDWLIGASDAAVSGQNKRQPAFSRWHDVIWVYACTSCHGSVVKQFSDHSDQPAQCTGLLSGASEHLVRVLNSVE